MIIIGAVNYIIVWERIGFKCSFDLGSVLGAHRMVGSCFGLKLVRYSNHSWTDY